MRRVMSLWLPRWPIDRRRRIFGRPSPDRPYVLSASVGNRRLVTAVNAAAEALGITPGLSLADARARHPALIVAEADPAGDAAALTRLAQWCGRYSPWTASHGADGIWLDVTGCAHLRGGEASLAAEVVARLAEAGITCRAAIADTAGAAWAVARCGGAQTAILPPGGVRAAIAGLPVAALRLDPALAVELERLGLRAIGDLYPLPRAALAARFGDAVAERLDQALGAAPEPLSPLSPTPMRWARRRFAEPIVPPEVIAAAVRTLLETLCRRLDEESLGARRLVLTLYRVDGTTAEVATGTARPSRDSHHLLRLFAERLGEIDPGLGIEDMVLAATRVETLAAAQLNISLSPRGTTHSIALRSNPPGPTASGRPGCGRGPLRSNGKVRGQPLAPPHPNPLPEGRGNILAFPDGKTMVRQQARALLAAEGKDRDGTDPAALAALVDRLANRLGPQAVGRLVPQESHMPERAACFAPAFTAADKAWRLAPARPVRLLPRAEPIKAWALVPDDPPNQFEWRRRMHLVRRADGPERVLGEWWRGAEDAAELRDYYRVEDEAGRRFWLYRAGLYRTGAMPRWFLHGLFA